jgi:DNA-binding FrmR family transcriptional regulator
MQNLLCVINRLRASAYNLSRWPMKYEAVGDKLIVRRDSAEKTPYKQRLSRAEGQIRGLNQMIEENRYCGDALQQCSAVIAAVREVALMLIAQQLRGQVEFMSAPAMETGQRSVHPDVTNFMDLLRSTYRFQ